MKRRRELRERLSTQKALVGILQTHPNPVLAEMAGMCGYDFIILDGEHGWFSEMDHLQTIQVLAPSGLLVLVRLSGHDVRALGRYLDMGADGIVVPNVATAEQARALVRAMAYPPAGIRGFAAAVHRETRYGLDIGTHLEAPRANAALIVIIESELGVANAAEILSTEGVDGAFIGPADLSGSLGGVGDFSNPAYGEAITSIERAAYANGKLLGTGPHPGYPLTTLVARGHRLLILGADMPLIRQAMSAEVSAAKSTLAMDVLPTGAA